tara:strand:+ start:2833 stop:3060 length:228 start_codon:yes stop_codon:yes gene_type:complete
MPILGTSQQYLVRRLRLHVMQASISLTAGKSHACRLIRDTLSSPKEKTDKKNVSPESINLIQVKKIVLMPIPAIM